MHAWLHKEDALCYFCLLSLEPLSVSTARQSQPWAGVNTAWQTHLIKWWIFHTGLVGSCQPFHSAGERVVLWIPCGVPKAVASFKISQMWPWYNSSEARQGFTAEGVSAEKKKHASHKTRTLIKKQIPIRKNVPVSSTGGLLKCFISQMEWKNFSSRVIHVYCLGATSWPEICPWGLAWALLLWEQLALGLGRTPGSKRTRAGGIIFCQGAIWGRTDQSRQWNRNSNFWADLGVGKATNTFNRIVIISTSQAEKLGFKWN